MTLQEFKEQHGIKTVSFQRFNEGKRMVANCLTRSGDGITLFLSSRADVSKPLAVFKGAHNALWVGNQAQALETIQL